MNDEHDLVKMLHRAKVEAMKLDEALRFEAERAVELQRRLNLVQDLKRQRDEESTWLWMGDESDNLDTFSESAAITISAGALRALVHGLPPKVVERLRRVRKSLDEALATGVDDDELSEARQLVDQCLGDGSMRDGTRTLADASAQLANVSGALSDADVPVPASPWRYGEAVREIIRQRDAATKRAELAERSSTWNERRWRDAAAVSDAERARRQEHEASLRGRIFADFSTERDRQDEKHGKDRDLPLVDPRCAMSQRVCEYHLLPSEADAKARCEKTDADGCSNFATILVEELCETVNAATEPAKARAELVQVGAVVVHAIETLDRRTQKDSDADRAVFEAMST